ncbi:MAG: hypothetical protein M1820_000681 [Bogoriella megaspora]|nr:MAG: hypothetical protein M1820_000681 [Bogoriella megaspora]
MLMLQVDIPVDQKARAFFFCHHVSGFSKAYDVLEGLYEHSSKPLTASVDAVSLAFFDLLCYNEKASQLSRTRYWQALSLLNASLESAESAKSDETLLSVLLLDMFVKLTNHDPPPSEAWMSHIKGALALANMRGKSQLSEYTATRLANRVLTNFLVTCNSTHDFIPPELLQLRSALEPPSKDANAKWQLNSTTIEYTNLTAAIARGHLENAETTSRAMKIDSDFISFAQSMPQDWYPQTIYIDVPSDRIFERHYYVYPNHSISQAWVAVRALRIMLNDIARKHSPFQPSVTDHRGDAGSEPDVATETIDSLAREICASLPQYTLAKARNSRAGTNPVLQRIQCYTLLWQMYVAGSAASDGSGIKDWIIKQLHFLSDDIGIRDANYVAEVLKNGVDTNPWTIHNFLGTYAFIA